MIHVTQFYTLIMHKYNSNLSLFDEKLSFFEHIDVKIKKATVGVKLCVK